MFMNRGLVTVYADLQMKTLFWCLFCGSKAHPPPAESLQARLWPGEGTPSLFPPPADQGLPHSAVGGEVAQTFRSHSEETPAKDKRGRPARLA
jgi:hypothetical protein